MQICTKTTNSPYSKANRIPTSEYNSIRLSYTFQMQSKTFHTSDSNLTNAQYRKNSFAIFIKNGDKRLVQKLRIAYKNPMLANTNLQHTNGLQTYPRKMFARTLNMAHTSNTATYLNIWTRIFDSVRHILNIRAIHKDYWITIRWKSNSRPLTRNSLENWFCIERKILYSIANLQLQLTVACLRRCARPLERIRVLEDSRVGAMWLSRASECERSETRGPLGF